MSLDPNAGKPAQPSMLVNVPRLITAYYTGRPDLAVRAQRVAFGTSGHRGSSFALSFNEAHILAITQAICQYRKQEGITGPLFLAMDTHALSDPAWVSALEVLAANGVDTMIDSAGGYTPTPALSHAILTYNRGRADGLADGIVITPSHNPPERRPRQRTPGGRAAQDPAHALRGRAEGIHDTSARLCLGVRERPGQRAGYGRHPRRAPQRGRGPAGRRWGGLLGPHQRTVRRAADGAERYGRPHLPLHVGRLGRQDPHGLLVAIRHGRTDRAKGPLRRGLRLRYRPRPARRGDAQRGPAKSQSLPGGGDFVPVPAPAGMARGGGGGQDAGVEQHDRSRRGQPEAEDGGSAGGIQVDGGRVGERRVWLWRRGERRRIVPAARRRGVDHGQGWHHHGAAGGRDPGAHGPRSGRDLPRADGEVRRAGL